MKISFILMKMVVEAWGDDPRFLIVEPASVLKALAAGKSVVKKAINAGRNYGLPVDRVVVDISFKPLRMYDQHAEAALLDWLEEHAGLQPAALDWWEQWGDCAFVFEVEETTLLPESDQFDSCCQYTTLFGPSNIEVRERFGASYGYLPYAGQLNSLDRLYATRPQVQE